MGFTQRTTLSFGSESYYCLWHSVFACREASNVSSIPVSTRYNAARSDPLTETRFPHYLPLSFLVLATGKFSSWVSLFQLVNFNYQWTWKFWLPPSMQQLLHWTERKHLCAAQLGIHFSNTKYVYGILSIFGQHIFGYFHLNLGSCMVWSRSGTADLWIVDTRDNKHTLKHHVSC